MASKKKISFPLIKILIIIFIIISGPTAYRFIKLKKQLSADQIENWKFHEVYSSTNFMFQLPNNWHRTSSENQARFLNYYPGEGQDRGFDPQKDQGLLKIEIYPSQSQQTLEEFVSQNKSSCLDLDGSDCEWVAIKTKIGGQPAIKVNSFVYFVQHPQTKQNFSIAFLLDFNNSQELANQILSTFQFVE